MVYQTDIDLEGSLRKFEVERKGLVFFACLTMQLETAAQVLPLPRCAVSLVWEHSSLNPIDIAPLEICFNQIYTYWPIQTTWETVV